MHEQGDVAAILGALKSAVKPPLSVTDIAELSGVPERTIENWLNRTTLRPSQEGLLRVAKVLAPGLYEVNRLLRAGGYPTVDILLHQAKQHNDPELVELLAPWNPAVPRLGSALLRAALLSELPAVLRATFEHETPSFARALADALYVVVAPPSAAAQASAAAPRSSVMHVPPAEAPAVNTIMHALVEQPVTIDGASLTFQHDGQVGVAVIRDVHGRIAQKIHIEVAQPAALPPSQQPVQTIQNISITNSVGITIIGAQAPPRRVEE